VIAMDRVALVAWVWFLGWIAIGDGAGRLLGMPGTGMVLGFIVALLTIFVWPWLLPRFIDDWMHRG
jgi:hypothetical protein